MPFANNSFDLVFSCGVLEYFTPRQVRSIIEEAFRVSSKRVIIMVPNAMSLPYRLGKWYQEKRGQWPWGGEVPSYSLKSHFRATGSRRLREFSLAAEHSLGFLTMPLSGPIRAVLSRLLRVRDRAATAPFRQGYLLISIGEKN